MMSTHIFGTALMVMMATVPELTQEQQLQALSATDWDPDFDRPAIFPLLRNTLQWDTTIDRGGAMIPDFAAIYDSPAQHRGGLFLIEGDLARVVPTGPLAQNGPWDGKLKEWDIVVSVQPVQTAVVFLTVPPPDPNPGTRVEVVVRFYKMMRRRDEKQGQLTDFPLFVGRTARVGRPHVGRAPAPATPLTVMLLAVVAMMVGYVLMRRSILLREPVAGRKRGRAATLAGSDVRQAERNEQAIAPNPAEALDQLARQSGREVNDAGAQPHSGPSCRG